MADMVSWPWAVLIGVLPVTGIIVQSLLQSRSERARRADDIRERELQRQHDLEQLRISALEESRRRRYTDRIDTYRRFSRALASADVARIGAASAFAVNRRFALGDNSPEAIDHNARFAATIEAFGTATAELQAALDDVAMIASDDVNVAARRLHEASEAQLGAYWTAFGLSSATETASIGDAAEIVKERVAEFQAAVRAEL